MSGTTGNRNRAIAVAVRDLVATYAQHAGFPEAAPRPYARKLSEALDDPFAPDVSGIPGVHLAVSSRLNHRLSEDLDAARRAGAINGAGVAALVQWRSERDVSEAFVVLGLDDFLQLVSTP